MKITKSLFSSLSAFNDHSDLKSSAQTSHCHFAKAQCDLAPSPELILWSKQLSSVFEKSESTRECLSKNNHEVHPLNLPKKILDLLSGRLNDFELEPIATRYGGHQFGHWAGQLGDGRAILLGDLWSSNNEPFEMQLKGAGRTIYSRGGDGKAVLRSSLREYLCSEYMFHLRVPTTRALSCLVTGENVERDMFYNGNPKDEPGAIVTRIAPSFIRFGHFEILATHGEYQELNQLFAFVLDKYFSYFNDFNFSENDTGLEWLHKFYKYEDLEDFKVSSTNKVIANQLYSKLTNVYENLSFSEDEKSKLKFNLNLIFNLEKNELKDKAVMLLFTDICLRMAYLASEWMRVGFVHGVMNTDNMSILGLTIDYGPFAFLDDYAPDWTPNTTDNQNRRYRFSNQPSIAHWNLQRLAEAFSTVMVDPEKLNLGLNLFVETFSSCYKLTQASKLGLKINQIEAHNLLVLEELNHFLTSEEIDFTIFYNKLYEFRKFLISNDISNIDEIFGSAQLIFTDCFYMQKQDSQRQVEREHYLKGFLKKYMSLFNEQDLNDRLLLTDEMSLVNPTFSLRNFILQSIIDHVQSMMMNGQQGLKNLESSVIVIEGQAVSFNELIGLIRTPYSAELKSDLLKQILKLKRPEWARHKPGCSALSCSS